MTQNKKSLYDFTFAALAEHLDSTYYARIVFEQIYEKRISCISQISMKNKKERLNNFDLDLPEVHSIIHSEDGRTRKYILRLHDGKLIESVWMNYHGRYTVCVSTQVGCAMGCVFCATGHMGFKRHLSVGEIVSQIMLLEKIEKHKIRNIVFMGMGEPLHNFDATMDAIDIFTDFRALAIARRHITLSTVGVVPQIRKLIEHPLCVNLAVSLHGASDTKRNRLVPIGKRWDLDELMNVCREYTERKKKRIFFEWTVIREENDRSEDAHDLGKLLQGIRAHVNLIPLNPIKDYAGTPGEDSRIQSFRRILDSYQIPNTIRQKRGIDVAAGCGQLQTEKNV
ncbi:23S rRNA (adenine(2503)-C(2))-methyltransferase RlmN [Candidatus Uabimicrobium amorphum]|uniref:Probable dual-specificity RNA methyltransferase RlmN n=1 Tax=Uabimicrobium amorphum TaxID=2596890 RepID=A0A5S9IK36_UABAM|nr:23S rRNA (adenine(2503)-C(2))-methyltransferase RlmN [Candidatus Uabimicrobium amorphum]BBM83001.1 putative dual-specificity RNA methyltransferaseRlmN [Candidatus Uabimicrobium amorphum]